MYSFLLIPRYNHDKIIGEFKQQHQKVGILHFPCGGYFFVLSINILPHEYAIAYSLCYEIFSQYTQSRIANSTTFCTLAITLAGFFSCALFDELEQEINPIIFFLA